MNHDQTAELQRAANIFVGKYLKGWAPIIADGDAGPATRKRIKQIMYYVGYSADRMTMEKVNELFALKPSHDRIRELRNRMANPSSTKYADKAAIKRGQNRRTKQKKLYEKNHQQSNVTSGVSTFDGRSVAAWLKPYLEWAREHGWKGTLNSGWRDPDYSEHLCYNMCGRPSCPGRCAGKSSNHSGSVKPAGAIDVSDYVRFGQLMRQCPLQPHIFNALGAQDPVHFSVSGR